MLKYTKPFGTAFRAFVTCVVLLLAAVPAGRCGQSRTIDSWRDQVLYFVLLDRFENGCPCDDFDVNPRDPRGFHGGDIDGLRARLDWLTDLGVTGVWLSPVARNRPMPFYGQQAYHGYWIWDFFRVDPRFGTMRKLRELRDDMDRRGLALLLDMVVNHAGYDAPIAALHPDWFHANGNITDWNDRNQLESYRLFGLPDFASEKPVVQRFFSSVAKYWVEQIRPAGFRLDAVKHVPISFWKTFNSGLRERYGEGFLTLGELMDGNPATLSDAWNAGSFGTLFDYPLYYTLRDVISRGGDARQLGVRFAMDRVYPDAGLLATFLDNHDLDRFITSCGGNRDRYLLALSLLLTARGIPTLCYGDEIGLDGAIEPWCSTRRSMRFEAGNPILGETKKLIAVRKSHPALTRGMQIHLAMDRDMYAFGRLTPDQQAIVVFNFATASRDLNVPLPAPARKPAAVNDLLGCISANITDGTLRVKLGGLRCALFVIDADIPGRWTREHEMLLRSRLDPFARGRKKISFELKLDEELPDRAAIHLIGGLPQLGDWNSKAERLPRLTKTGDLTWMTSLELPIGAVFEYKFLMKMADGSFRWQEGANAILDVNADGGGIIRHDW
ncbi:MAG TPA: alpha-amylase family glycosyl hydrolase [Candidatus Ozemobacteraceae bacterium]|nr:alpha-amylase family glycosyl hydrolase [Candidatus Ozemobacteraceae bacterium]